MFAVDFKKDVPKYREQKNDNPFRKMTYKKGQKELGLNTLPKNDGRKWISITIILKQVKKPVIYHFPISSKYTEKSAFICNP